MTAPTIRWLKILVFVLILVFYGSFLIYKMELPAADDLPRQMRNGIDVLTGNFDALNKNVYSYTESDRPFANHHWGSGVFFYLLYQAAGFGGLSIFKVILMLSAFALLFRIAAKKADFWLVAFLSIPAILIFLGRTGLRPEIFSYFFITLYLYLLMDLEEYPGRKRIFWLIPVQLLWANTHLFSVTGPMLVAGFLFEKIILNPPIERAGYKNLKSNALIKKLALLFVILALVIFINPFGLVKAFSSFRLNATPDSPVSSAETVSVAEILKTTPKWNNIAATVFMPVVILLAFSFAAAFLFRLKRKQPLFSDNFIFYFLAGASTATLGFFVIRSLSLFGLMFLPAASVNFNGIFIEAKKQLSSKWPRKERFLRQTLPFFLIAALLWLTTLARGKILPDSKLGIGITPQSESSAMFFKEQGLEGPIFNDTDIGSYLIYYLYPNEKVFSDNRFRDAYSAEFFRDVYLPIIQDEEKWREAFEKYRFNAVFFNHYDNVRGARDFITRRMSDADWPLVYADRYVLIFVRNNPKNKEVIQKFQITQENAGQKLNYLSASSDADEQIAGADLLALIGRMDLATPTYMKAVTQWPDRGKVWMVMGKIELGKDPVDSNPALALIFMQKAIDVGWKTTESLSYLALAYFRTGQIDKAEEAVMEELKIDPNSEDGKKWIGVLAEERDK